MQIPVAYKAKPAAKAKPAPSDVVAVWVPSSSSMRRTELVEEHCHERSWYGWHCDVCGETVPEAREASREAARGWPRDAPRDDASEEASDASEEEPSSKHLRR